MRSLRYVRAMKRILTATIGFSLVACAALAQTPPAPLDLGPPETLTIVTENGEHNFSVEIADEPAEQARGMMFRESMGDDTGMLFEFAEPKVASIWMKNTALSLDVLFVRSNGKILKIEHGATPYSERSMSSEGTVGAVLELAAGRTQALGIQPGDVVKHEFFGNTSEPSEK